MIEDVIKRRINQDDEEMPEHASSNRHLFILMLTLIISLMFPVQGNTEPTFQDIFNKRSAIMLLIDPDDGVIVDANATAALFYGYSRAQLRTMKIQQINQLSAAQVAIERQLAKNEGRNFFVFRHKIADGEIRTVEVQSVPLDFDGRILLHSIIRDISKERKAAEEFWHYQTRLEEMTEKQTRKIRESTRYTIFLLSIGAVVLFVVVLFLFQTLRHRKRIEVDYRESEKKFRTLVSTAPVCIHEVSLEGILVSMNPAGLKMMGVDEEAEVCGLKYLDIPVPEDRKRIANLMNQARNGKGSVFEFSAMGDTGLVHFSSNLEPIKDEQGNVVKLMGVIQDITENKRSGDLLLEAKNEAEKANKAKSEFLASMSHELRTPLNAVLGFAQMLQYDPTTPPTDRQLIHIQSILEGGDHLLELINEILDLAKIEADQLNISLDTIPADDVIAECISLTTPIGKQRGINIIYENDTGSKTPLYTDRTRLKQCLLNLLSNAIKFNQNDGTVRISARETTDGFLRLCVTDTGIGIAKKDYPNVFQLFHRLNADPMISREGTGIGLTVTKMLIERLAGRIGFESKEGKGSTFWIELPLTTNEEVLIWSDVMRTRIDAIDKDHQAMVSLLNKIAHGSVNKEETAGIVKELVDYTRYHFLREETIMLACDFPNMIEHRASHAAITLKVSEMAFSWVKNREHALLQRFHKTFRDWLSDHIINEDPKIGPYARDKKDEIHDALDKLALAGKNKDDR